MGWEVAAVIALGLSVFEGLGARKHNRLSSGDVGALAGLSITPSNVWPASMKWRTLD